jgi:hypothetical protein
MNENRYARLTKPLLARSVSDDYEDAKKEWRMTGQVWRGPPPFEHPCGHTNQCLCGKNITWHFEVENTHTDELQIFGSSCIENWMVLRHLTEVKGMDIADITDEVIEEWLANAVNVIKAEWWFAEHGSLWNLMYDAVAEIDLRTNINQSGKVWDAETRRYEKKINIRKRGKGKPGDLDYKMSSVIWRWNHPDNPKNQQEKYGWPQDALWRDICILYAQVGVEKERIKLEDDEREHRIENLAAKEVASRLRENERRAVEQEIFERNCEFYDLPLFDVDEASNDWESKFLQDMKSRIQRDSQLSEKQISTLRGIVTGVGPVATDKQIRYLEKLGVEIPDEGLTKKQASDLIGAALAERAAQSGQ